MIRNPVTLIVFLIGSVILAPQAIGASPVPLETATNGSDFPVVTGGIHADDWENGMGDKFIAMLEETGALGSFARGADVVVVVPSSGSSSLTVDSAAMLGFSVVVEERDVELSEVREIVDAVSASEWQPREPGMARPLAYFDAMTGKVRILTDAPLDEFKDLLDRYGSIIDYVGRPAGDFSRRNDIEPHWGGARIKSSTTDPEWWCTSGFSVLN